MKRAVTSIVSGINIHPVFLVKVVEHLHSVPLGGSVHDIIPSVVGNVNIGAMSNQESDYLHVPIEGSILQGIPSLATGLNACVDPFLQCFLPLPPLLLCAIHECFPVVAWL